MRARVSRRRMLAAGVGGAAAVATVAAIGCGGDAGPAPTPAPRRGGTLRTATTLPLAYGLDPQAETGTGLAIFPRVYGYLLHVDPADGSTVYDHAHSVEQPDPQTYIIRMRDGVRFQDIPPVGGRAVTAEDAVLSLLRFRDNPIVLNKTWHATVLDSADVIDPLTVRVTTKRAYAYSVAEIGAIGAGAILPKELISGVDLSSSGVGSGPFRIDAVEAGATRASRAARWLLSRAGPVRRRNGVADRRERRGEGRCLPPAHRRHDPEPRPHRGGGVGEIGARR